MTPDEVIADVRSWDGSLILSPAPGSDFPEIAWGDSFFYYAPDGQVPQNTQPYGTIVTKDYPDDTLSRLDEPGRWRLNVHVGSRTFEELTGEAPRAISDDWDYAEQDTVLPHPVYGQLGWVSVVDPGERTGALAMQLLRRAHDDARVRAERRHGGQPAAVAPPDDGASG
ncbi:MAG TPA: DUF6194 family protein [Naasia sp.]|jgi:hypothetical protein